MAKPKPSRVAAALQYLQQMRDRAADFGGGVVDTLGDRARDVGGLAYEALTSDPAIGRMTTAEFSQAAADRPSTPRLDATAQGIGAMGKALVTQPVQTAKAVVVDPVVEAFESPRAMGQFAGEFVNPLRIAAALRKTAPIAELDVYHGTPHRFEPTEENPLGEFDASKIGTGEGAQAYGHGVYLAEDPKIAAEYSKRLWANKNYLGHPEINAAEKKASNAANAWFQSVIDGAPTETKVKLKAVYETADAELKTTKSQYGKQMYKADLPDEMIDKMLDWDEPIGAGKENLLVEIAKNPKLDVKQYEELLGLTPKSVNQQETGEMLYKVLREDLGSDTEASAVFQQAGFPGIKYLDALAKKRRSDVDWTDKKDKRNFVVFPGEEKKVKILKRD